MALVEGRRQLGGPQQDIFIDEMLLHNNSSNIASNRTDKTIIFGMRDATKIYLFVLNNRKARTLIPIINRNAVSGSVLVTDGYASYKRLALEGWTHAVVNHSKEWKNADGYVHAPIDAVFRLVRRNIRVNHLHVSPSYLWLYLKEIEFRFNRRFDGARMFPDLVEFFPTADERAMLEARSRTDYYHGTEYGRGLPRVGRSRAAAWRQI